MTLPVEWTPADSLPHNASDEQISLRTGHKLAVGLTPIVAAFQVAYELRAAVQAEADAKHASLMRCQVEITRLAEGEFANVIKRIEDACFPLNGEFADWSDALTSVVDSCHGEMGRRITAEAKVKELESALASARKDAERLDWLGSHSDLFGPVTDYDCEHEWSWKKERYTFESEGTPVQSLREFIDTMTQLVPPPPGT